MIEVFVQRNRKDDGNINMAFESNSSWVTLKLKKKIIHWRTKIGGQFFKINYIF